MLDKHIKKIEPIIEELKGKRIEKVDGVLIPEYLYSFPNGLWLSFDLDKRDNYFDVKLGRLFSLDDVMPRLIVLESIEYYFAAVNELKLGQIKYDFSHISYEIENVFEILKNNLKTIVENYYQLKEVGKTKVLISKEEERLKSYLLADLSYSSNLELDLKDRIESFTSRLNTIDSIIIRLYEDLVEEKLSGSNYQKMLDKYQDEQKKLNSQLIEIESKLTQENKTEANIETFKQIARKYIDFDELTPEIINNLISHITVSHVKVINGTKFREIKIIYKFIG